MLQGLEAKSTMMAKMEAVQYTKFEYWCANSEKTLGKAISREKDTIKELEDKIASLTEEESLLNEQIADLDKEIGDLDKAEEAAALQRKKENTLYEDTVADFDGTIKAVDDALKLVEKAK